MNGKTEVKFCYLWYPDREKDKKKRKKEEFDDEIPKKKKKKGQQRFVVFYLLACPSRYMLTFLSF